MKKLMLSFVVLVLTALSFQSMAAAQPTHAKSMANKAVEGTTTLHFFWSHDCPHCVAAHPFIDKLKAEYPWLRVRSYEISRSSKNAQLFHEMARAHGKETSFVPTFFVGNKMIVGYTSAATSGGEIRRAVLAAHNK